MRKVLFISLGCDKNPADSEEMLGMLVTHGYEITNDETEANVAIINTCAFIHDAKEESIANILEMARYKEEGQLKVLLITGCLAQRYKEEIVNEIPEVDAVLGTTSFDDLLEAIDQAFGGERYLEFKDISYTPQVETKRMITTGGHFEYLKIADYSETSWKLPQCANGKTVKSGTLSCRTGCKRTDSCSTGDDGLWRGFIWRKITS